MNKENTFVIGVDAGGTKTLAALADLSGHIVKTAKAGPASLRANGIEVSCANVAKAIGKLLAGKKSARIVSTFIGFPAMAEEYRHKQRTIAKELAKNKTTKGIFYGAVNVGSDQLVAYRAGTDSKCGIMAIAGTGCAVHGWNGEKEAKVSGWGWLSNEGSAFWIGKNVFLSILKAFDGRGEKTVLTEMVFREFKLKNTEDLMVFAYKDPANNLPRIALLCDKAALGGDAVARGILCEAGNEIAVSICAAAKQLDFAGNAKIPLVLIGGVFKSTGFYRSVINNVKKCGFDFEIIEPDLPVLGAVKLAIEHIKR